MTPNRITINGQQYDSPEAMPPDVRLLYEDALRTVGPPPAGGQSGGSAQVFTGRTGSHFGASVVVNKVIKVNDRTYGNVDELPPDMRKLYEEAMKSPGGQVTQPRTGFHVSVNVTGPEVRTVGDSGMAPTSSASTESRLRNIPMSLAITIVIALILWALLGR